MPPVQAIYKRIVTKYHTQSANISKLLIHENDKLVYAYDALTSMLIPFDRNGRPLNFTPVQGKILDMIKLDDGVGLYVLNNNEMMYLRFIDRQIDQTVKISNASDLNFLFGFFEKL